MLTPYPVCDIPAGLAQEKRDVQDASRPSIVFANSILTGEVVNGVDDKPIQNARVWLAGCGQLAKTDANGKFCLSDITASRVSVQISAEGYRSDCFDEILPSASEKFIHAALSPELRRGEIRIILTWSATPADLDSHLYGPCPSEPRFHVYFSHPDAELVHLDIDRTDGYGPETITIRRVTPGQYRYMVHDYTNRSNPMSHALSQSGAEIRVHLNREVHRFRAQGTQSGAIWHVFDLEVAGDSSVTLHPVDRYENSLPSE